MTMLKRWVIASCAAAMVVSAGAGGSGDAEDIDYQQRRAYVENLDEGTREKLSEKKRRFYDLSKVEKERLRELHRALQAQPNREELEQVMEAYYKWVLALDPPVRARLNNESSPEERIKQVIKYKAMPHHRGRYFGGPNGFPWPPMGERSQERIWAFRLATERYDVLKSWAGQFVADDSGQLADCLSGKVKEKWEASVRDALSIKDDREARLWRVLAGWYLAAGPDQELPLDEDDIEDLKRRLGSDSDKTPLAQVPADRRVQVIKELLRRVVREQLSWESGDLTGLITRDEVEDFISAHPEARERLPSGNKELATYMKRRRYVESRLGASRGRSEGRPRGPGFRDGPRRGGPPGPGQGSMGGSRPSFDDPRRGPAVPDRHKPPAPDRPGEPR